MSVARKILGSALTAVLMVGCGESMSTPDGGSAIGGGSATGGGSAAGGGTGGGQGQQTGDIVAVAAANPEFSILVQAVQKAGLVAALQEASPKKTVFAPTNAAFASLLTELGYAGLDDLTAEQLKPILLYHVLGTEIRATAATSAAQANTKVDALGGKIQLSLAGSTIKLDNRASVVTADVLASNGVIHAIDKVILPSIVDIATTTPAVSSLVAALGLADGASPSPALIAALDNDSAAAVTVFAPTNDAFTGLVNALKGNDNGVGSGITALTSFTPTQLIPVLKYHVATAKYLFTAVPTAATKIDTLGGRTLVQRTGAAVKVDGANVAIANLLASNGVIHVIDGVLLPSITDLATTTPAVSSLVAALQLADTGTPSPGLVAAFDNDSAAKVTVFAPTNDAFTALVTALNGSGISALTSFRPDQVLPVLAYHVATANYYAAQVPTAATGIATLGGELTVQRTGNAVKVDAADVVIANLFTSNGTVHVVNQVLLPSITDVVTSSSRFSSLKAAVLAADGVSTTTPKIAAVLNGAGPFTLFAPTNAAFTALGNGAPSGQALTNVLAYHAVGERLVASTLLGYATANPKNTAFPGKTIDLSAVSGAVKVKDSTTTLATVNGTNFFTSNGVIHAIDKVLIPAP
jgi:transforming growth factor-beta-induced protein